MGPDCGVLEFGKLCYEHCELSTLVSCYIKGKKGAIFSSSHTGMAIPHLSF